MLVCQPGQGVKALVDLEVGVVVVVVLFELVLLLNVVGYEFVVDAHEFRSVHGCVQVKV